MMVLAGGQELSQMNDAEERRRVSIFEVPKILESDRNLYKFVDEFFQRACTVGVSS